MDLVSEKVVRQFIEDGFAVIPGFLSPSEVADLKAATNEVVSDYCKDSQISIFRNQSRDTYFAESGDKIRGFYEEGAIDKAGCLRVEKAEDGLNKVGHALHTFHPTFRRITFSSKVKEVLKRLTSIKEATINQSMVIFKHPKVGGVGTLVGFWIALDEATKLNGCLHFFAGSHKAKKVYQRFIRNQDKSSETLFVHTGEPVPKLPSGTLVPATCKPGDLVVIDGLVIHQSEPNTSDQPRMAYTFHVIDGSVSYSSENWLQPTSANTFEKLNDVDVQA
ncbi:phytanoyl-CoA dioxygenase domain-containing protein 1 homolog isoform X2 [Folsomia candida]|uniref:phytanoyl-CoA dioxygenase domain-containing protein 1 homolog isoform X2 n=1 Tax=Folsomia candida TaxID=158441 RepID=UPI000B9088D4|nr:phytanoyl-CoA dioxygenase domain-containing protein 1 homolog isoform X2 [Folsomia candida]